MSIQRETRTNGKRCYAVRWTDESGRHRSRRFDRKGDAEKFEVEVKRLKQTGDLMSFDGGRITLADFGREWFTSYAKEHLAESTQAGYAGMWDRHILPRLGGHTLRRLYAEPKLIQDVIRDMANDGVGPEATRSALVLLQGVLQRAVEWKHIPSNPARLVRKPSNKNKRAATVLAPAKVEALRAAVPERDRERSATLISVLAYAGLRPDEALALRWRNIGKNTIRVERGSSDGKEKSTKTGRSRSVRLLAPLADDLAAWRTASSHGLDDDLVFPRPDGAMCTIDDWKNWSHRVFQSACIAIELGRIVKESVTDKRSGKSRTQRRWRAMDGTSEGPRPYDLRHSFVSLLIHEGMSVVEVAGQAGHAPTMTLDTYAHVIAEFDPADRRAAAELIAEARGSGLRESYVFPESAPCPACSRQQKTPPERGFVLKPMSGLEPLTPSLRVKSSVPVQGRPPQSLPRHLVFATSGRQGVQQHAPHNGSPG